jgi:hypothetical protein
MGLFKVLVCIALAYGGYKYWTEHRMSQAVQAQVQAAGVTGFVPLPTPEGQNTRSVIVFAPANCPEDAGQRADELMRRLADKGIPAVRSSSANFNFTNPDATVMAQVQRVMGGEQPIVFVNGTGKANPSFDDVVAQYQGSR